MFSVLPIYAHFYCHFCTFCMHEPLPHMGHVCVTAAYVNVDCHVCACRLPCMCLLTAMYVHVDRHIWAFCMAEQLPHMGHFCACSLPCVRLLIAISVPVDCHLWARTIATHGPLLCMSNAMHWPLDCHLCTCWFPHVGQLSATYAPLVCHMWATCGPDNGHMCATRGPALQNACGPHVYLKWELFPLPHVSLVWPTCGMFAGNT